MEKSHTRHMVLWGSAVGLVGWWAVMERLGYLARLVMPHASQYERAHFPVPKAIDWHHPLINFLRRLEASAQILNYAPIVLFIVAGYFLLRFLRPRMSLYLQGHDLATAPRRVLDTGNPKLQRWLDVRLLWRLLIGSGVTFWLIGVWWGLYQMWELYLFRALQLSPRAENLMGGVFFWLAPLFRGQETLLSIVYFPACGLTVFLLWSEGGLCDFPRVSGGALLSAIGRGLLVGLLGAVAMFPLFPPGFRLVMNVLNSVGRTEDVWRAAALGAGVGGWLAFAAWGMAAYALARPDISWRQRLSLGALPACLLALLAVSQLWVYHRVETRLDYSRNLRSVVHRNPRLRSIPLAEGMKRTLLMVGRRYGVHPSWVVTAQGTEATEESKRRTWRYLKEKNFRSCRTYDALVHLHDCASLEWSSTDSLKVDLTSVEHFPDVTFVELLIQKLFECPVTPENRRYLDQLADGRLFNYTTRGAKLTVGDLYYRFGDERRARQWYGRAGLKPQEIAKRRRDRLVEMMGIPVEARLPQEFEERLRRAKPLTSGVITGRLLLNGKPARGVRIGVMRRSHAPEFFNPNSQPKPFLQRWVVAGATPDADGRFRFDHLGTGAYIFLLTGSTKTLPPRFVEVRRPPGWAMLNDEQPARDVGDIDIVINKDKPPPPRQRERDGVVTTQVFPAPGAAAQG